jgi:hypothetical protein
MPKFSKTRSYLENIDINSADPLDKVALELLRDEEAYERASQALRRRFVRGADMVEGIDRGGRRTHIKRERANGKYNYFLEGVDSSWNEPEDRIWVVAMYALWQRNK